nr:MAG TPA: hypothetical protein [Caudoviricetes sp.]
MGNNGRNTGASPILRIFFIFFTHFHVMQCNSLIINLPAVPQ